MVKRDLHGLILALLGGTLVKLTVTGQYERYVKAAMRPYLFAAGLILLAVAAAALWPAVFGRRSAETDDHHGDAGHAHTGDGHGHRHGRADMAWLLVVPAAVVLLIAPPAIGSYSAGRSGTALGAASSSDYPPLPAGDPVTVSVLDYASRAVFDGRSLAGRRVELSGFLLSNGSGGWYLTRMVITCCAADAQPIKVGLTGAVPANARANEWLEATGEYTDRVDKDPVNGQSIPYLSVTSSTPIPAPAQQYDS
ncbi:TIGR03943 family putative permease subunit [Rugosimonospora africana]|uniref:Membrane protein n=1 Tax=Rugosimonospora africana TaxID=556532 RepID=A0A8J3VWE6_9ACTN|nr:TIGR03943 family protein [Rugosimonospora africana]GIH21672.1 membrane protein [Rugosimonospora africana]